MEQTPEEYVRQPISVWELWWLNDLLKEASIDGGAKYRK